MADLNQLSTQADAFGVRPEIHEPEGLIFLRDLPDGVQHDPAFQCFVEECHESNLAAFDLLRTLL